MKEKLQSFRNLLKTNKWFQFGFFLVLTVVVIVAITAIAGSLHILK